MNEMPSAEFRKQYARLKEPTLVTVNGHPIGVWRPDETSWKRMLDKADSARTK